MIGKPLPIIFYRSGLFLSWLKSLPNYFSMNILEKHAFFSYKESLEPRTRRLESVCWESMLLHGMNSLKPLKGGRCLMTDLIVECRFD